MTALPACAADLPVFAPPPAWVRPAPLPAEISAPISNRADQPGITLLLRDQQLYFTPRGDDSYTEKITRVETPSGLDALGTISLAWDPATEALTVHKLHIIRGTQVIDALAAGQGFTILRRENNLDSAMLDGVLTAAIALPDLRVGDVVDLAFTVHDADPALGGTSEYVASWADAPITHVRVRAQWTPDAPVRWQMSEPVPGLVAATGATEASFSADHYSPAIMPDQAPARFRDGPQIEFTAFRDWAEVAAHMAPYYARAAELGANSPLRAEIARIKAASADPARRAEAALALVQDQVRYLFLGTNDGGLVPAPADLTWQRRFGDCKGKTVLLLALLHGLGIEAAPVLVSTDDGDGLNTRLPMVGRFDHVLVRAVITGRAYWLDGTRAGDRRLADIAVPAYFWGLPLQPGSAALVPITPTPLAQPSAATAIRIDARAGIYVKVPFHVDEILTGDAAISLREDLAYDTPAQLDFALREHWSKRYDFVDITAVSARFDDATGQERLTMDGLARLDWEDNRYETDDLGLGYRAHFARPPGLFKAAPYAVDFPSYESHRETILLPYNGAGFTIDGDDIDTTVAGVRYRRVAAIKNGVFDAQASWRSLQPEFAAAQGADAQAALNAMRKNTLFVHVPGSYWLTDAEMKDYLARKLTSAADFVERGNTLLDHDDLDHAIADLSAAARLQPDDDMALADRGLAYAFKHDAAAAERDFTAAYKINPKNPVIFRGRGLLALNAKHLPDAIAAFSASLQLDPDNDFALRNRGEAFYAAGDNEDALADFTAFLRQHPDSAHIRVLRTRVYINGHKPDLAAADIAALIEGNPNNAHVYYVAGLLYTDLHKPAQAAAAMDRMVAIEPSETNYLRRARYRDATDLIGRAADVAAALKVNPKSTEALEFRGEMQIEAGDFSGAITTLSTALAVEHDAVRLLAMRGAAYARTRQPDAALRDFAAARARAADAESLNTLCWFQATAGVALTDALHDCDAALAKSPGEPSFLDSRAFVLLRLQRYDDAIKAYSAALQANPTGVYSLYGRGVAERRRGDRRAADADLQAARQAFPRIAAVFAGYGVTP